MRGLATTIIACGLVTACGPGSPADGRWDPPQLVEMDDREDARFQQVVVDADGNVTAVWSQPDGTLTNLWANRLVPGAGWGTPTRIETAHTFPNASVAADPTGNVIAVWSQYDASGYGIGANRFVPGVGWGTPQLVRQAGSDITRGARVAVDAAGNAIAIWSEFSEAPTSPSIFSSRFEPAAGWSGGQWIAGSQWGVRVGYPDIAMTPAGIAIVVWSSGTPIPERIGQEIISFRRYVPGSGWDSGGSPSEAGTQSDKAQFPQVATDPDGNFIIVWQQNDSVMARRFVVGRGWDMLAILADERASAPWVVVDPAGIGTVIWNRGHATFTPDSGWGDGWVVSPPIASGITSMAVGPPGELFVVWTESGIRSNRPFGGSTPAAIDSSTDATGGYVAVDPHGNATAVWQRPDRGRVSIWASTFHPDAWAQLHGNH